MKNLSSLWYDFLMVESQNSNNTIRIDAETNPLLYKWASLIGALSIKESNMPLTNKDKEILATYGCMDEE